MLNYQRVREIGNSSFLEFCKLIRSPQAHPQAKHCQTLPIFKQDFFVQFQEAGFAKKKWNLLVPAFFFGNQSSCVVDFLQLPGRHPVWRGDPWGLPWEKYNGMLIPKIWDDFAPSQLS